MAETTHCRVSALIPARNEAENIARAVRSLAAQPEIGEIIAVDDGSEDGTVAILEALRAEIPCLRVITVGDPPPDWLGKSYALATAAREARGDWLLFTDADTRHHPGSLGDVLERAGRERADLISLSPGQETPTWWEKAVIPFVFAELASRYRFEDVSNPDLEDAAANGQYLLIRRPPYDQVGGHEAVRSEILEDVALARRVKSLGHKVVFLPGAAWATTRMYRRFADMWDGWRKNFYLLWGGALVPAALTFTRVWLRDVVPPLCCLAAIAFLADGGGAEAAGIALAFLAALGIRRLVYARQLTRIGFAAKLADYGMIGAGVFCAVLVSSLAAHRWLHSIRWKGRIYAVKGSTIRAGRPARRVSQAP